MQQPPPFSEILTQLAAFATAVATTTAAPALDWETVPADEEWNLSAVLCHLRDVELEIHQPRIHKVLAQENAFLSGIDADKWAEARDYLTQNGRAARDVFLVARQQTIDLLTGIDPAMWERPARHAFFGTTTLRELAYLAVRHDEVHLAQLDTLLAKLANPQSNG